MIRMVFGIVLACAWGCASTRQTDRSPDQRYSVFADHIAMHAKMAGISHAESAAEFRALGFTGFDAAWNADRELLDAAVAAGLKPACFYGGIPFAKPEAAARVNGFLSRAREYGVRRIMVVPQYSRKDAACQATEFDAILAGLNDVTARANRLGIDVTTEDVGLPWSPCAKWSNVRRMLAAVPNLHFTLDSGNLEYSDLTRDPLDVLHEQRAVLRHLHMKDHADEFGGRNVALGEGAVPNRQILDALKASGYAGWITVEHFTQADEDPYDLCRRSAAWLGLR